MKFFTLGLDPIQFIVTHRLIEMLSAVIYKGFVAV